MVNSKVVLDRVGGGEPSFRLNMCKHKRTYTSMFEIGIMLMFGK